MKKKTFVDKKKKKKNVKWIYTRDDWIYYVGEIIILKKNGYFAHYF